MLGPIQASPRVWLVISTLLDLSKGVTNLFYCFMSLVPGWKEVTARVK